MRLRFRLRIMVINETTTKERALQLNPVVLAFVGDAVYSLYIRTKLTLSVDKKSGALSEMAAKAVCAEAQADRADELFGILTEEEQAVFMRARNAKKPTHAKHSSIGQYNKSTGFEAVLGYLYLSGQQDRLDALLNYGEL